MQEAPLPATTRVSSPLPWKRVGEKLSAAATLGFPKEDLEKALIATDSASRKETARLSAPPRALKWYAGERASSADCPVVRSSNPQTATTSSLHSSSGIGKFGGSEFFGKEEKRKRSRISADLREAAHSS